MADSQDGVSLYAVMLRGVRHLIMDNGAPIPYKRSPAKRERLELLRQCVYDRTEAGVNRIRELECLMSIWCDAAGGSTIAPASSRRH